MTEPSVAVDPARARRRRGRPGCGTAPGRPARPRTAARARPRRTSGRTGRPPRRGQRRRVGQLRRPARRPAKPVAAARPATSSAQTRAPALDRLPEVGEGQAGVVDPLVQHDPAGRTGLRGDDGGVLGVAGGLVAEAPAVASRRSPRRASTVAQPTSVDDACGQRAVALVGVQEGGGRAELGTDAQGVPAGGLAAVVDGVGDLREVAADQVPVGAVAVGGEQDRPRRDLLASRRRASRSRRRGPGRRRPAGRRRAWRGRACRCGRSASPGPPGGRAAGSRAAPRSVWQRSAECPG